MLNPTPDETTTEVEPEGTEREADGTEREAESTEREADGEPEAAEAALIGEAEGVVDEGEIADTGVFLKGLIEALIFVSDKPLELKEIARGARVDRARAGELLDEIRRDYEERGLSLTEVAGGYAFRSNPLYAETEILEKNESRTKTDRGILYVETRAWNQKEEPVMSLRRRVLLPCREPR